MLLCFLDALSCGRRKLWSPAIQLVGDAWLQNNPSTISLLGRSIEAKTYFAKRDFICDRPSHAGY